MSFLAPLFLGGLALIGLPILIHRIRRPEREPVRFSSLMFVPDVPKQVIERRKIQHLLLLLLRILLLMLLVFAFSRPFWTERQQALLAGDSSSKHVILVDTSLSMSMGDRLSQAKQVVSDLLGKIPADDRVALGFFDRQGRTVVNFTSPGDKALGDALKNLQIRPVQGNYLAGLQFGEAELLKDMSEDAQQPAVLHLVSDFQTTSLEESDWRLSGRIQFQGHRVGRDDHRNLSLTEAHVRRIGDQGLQLAAKVKYWQGLEPQKVKVSLNQADPNAAAIPPLDLVLEPGGASLAVFDVPWTSDQPVTAYIEIESDDFALDNRYYLHWEPNPKQPLILVTQSGEPTPRSAAWFLENAIQAGEKTGWHLERMTLEQWRSQSTGSAGGKLALFVETGSFSAADTKALKAHLNGGGKAMLVLGESADGSPLASSFLRDQGIQWQSDENADNQRHEPWQWVAFDHPIFSPFAAARFNDFSQIRVYRRWRIALPDQATVLAKTAQGPLMAELNHGQGRALVWAFSPQLTWTNLPKHIKFVPILDECLKYLSPEITAAPNFETGLALSRLQSRLPVGTAAVQLPDGRQWDVSEQAGELVLEPGWVQRQQAGDWVNWASVNPPTAEGETAQWSPEEFALRLTAARKQWASPTTGETTQASLGIRKEFGFSLLLFLGICFILETWLAFRLSKSSKPITLPKEGS